MPNLKPKLTMNVGSMFSGKSTELLRQGQKHLLAGHKVLFIKPQMDNRYSDDEIVTHDGQKVQSINLKTFGRPTRLPEINDAQVILIDEIQFFMGIIWGEIEELLRQGKVIYCSGLDMDYRGEPFKTTAHLMAIADDVNKFKAVCADCGEDAYVTVKLTDSIEIVELGSQETYKPVCRSCFNKNEGV